MNQRYLPPSARMSQIRQKAVVSIPLGGKPAPAEDKKPKATVKKPITMLTPKPKPDPMPEPEAPEVPEYNDKMLKRGLLKLAAKAGVFVSEDDTKAEIIVALDEHYGMDG